MAKSDPDTVLLHARDDDRKEGEADGTITPGDAVEVSGEQTGGAKDLNELQRQSTDGEEGVLFAVAIEYSDTGMGIDDDYSDGDAMRYYVPLPGDELFMFHNTSEDISFGDQLVLSGDGTLRALDTAGGDGDEAVVAEAREAVSNSTGTEKTRVSVEVI